jgi:hypothetical protein
MHYYRRDHDDPAAWKTYVTAAVAGIDEELI